MAGFGSAKSSALWFSKVKCITLTALSEGKIQHCYGTEHFDTLKWQRVDENNKFPYITSHMLEDLSAL